MDRLGAWWDGVLTQVGETSLLAGWLVPVGTAVGVLSLLLTWWRDTRHLPRRVQVVLPLAAAALATGAGLWVNRVWRPVADGVGALVFVWIGVLLLFVMQAAAGPWRTRRRRRAVRLVATGAVLTVAAALAVNASYATYRSVAILLGTNVQTVPWAQADVAPRDRTVAVRDYTGEDAPASGQLTTVPIPSSDPGFHPRDAVVYVPPAYRAAVRPLLPVMVLMAGVPGSPMDWAGPGDLAATMNAFARAHGGLAPIVVVVDPLGGASLRNPLCSDTAAGAAATYVEQDVPAWIESTLQVDTDHAHWTVGGLSNGGTCALQAVTRSPDSYGQFLAMSAELHPTLGDEQRTVDQVFGGDRAAYLANDPLALLAEAARAGDGRYRGIAGVFSVGAGDSYVGGDVSPRLAEAARAAGIDAQVRVYPGGHTWSVWSTAFVDQLPWAAERMGLG